MKTIAMLGLMFIANAAFAFSHPKLGQKTKDILQFASLHSEFPNQGFDRFSCHNCSALKDAVFVAPVSTCGTGSCDYMLFRNKGADATYITTVSLKAGAFEFLHSVHNGLPDINSYRHMSADEGIVTKLEFDGQTYKPVGTEKKVSAADFQTEMKPEQTTTEKTK